MEPGSGLWTYDIYIARDTLLEPTEFFSIRFDVYEAVTNGRQLLSSYDYRIEIPGVDAVFSIDAKSSVIQEGDAGSSSPFTFEISRLAGTGVGAVNWSLGNTSGFADGTFSQTSGSVTFSEWETTKTVTINVVGNNTPDALARDFVIELTSNSPHTVILQDSLRVDLIDNDCINAQAAFDKRAGKSDYSIQDVTTYLHKGLLAVDSFNDKLGYLQQAINDLDQSRDLLHYKTAIETAKSTVELYTDIRSLVFDVKSTATSISLNLLKHVADYGQYLATTNIQEDGAVVTLLNIANYTIEQVDVIAATLGQGLSRIVTIGTLSADVYLLDAAFENYVDELVGINDSIIDLKSQLDLTQSLRDLKLKQLQDIERCIEVTPEAGVPIFQPLSIKQEELAPVAVVTAADLAKVNFFQTGAESNQVSVEAKAETLIQIEDKGGFDVLSLIGVSKSMFGVITFDDSELYGAAAGGFIRLVGFERVALTDKTIGFDLEGVAGQAYRLYQAAFDRAPDEVGLGYWISELDEGKSDLSLVSLRFIRSAEFQATYGAPGAVSDTQFVTLLYENVLDRAPDTAGLDYWLTDLSNGYQRENLLEFFSESFENKQNVIGAIEDGIEYIPWLA